jgi:hypothetical protein
MGRISRRAFPSLTRTPFTRVRGGLTVTLFIKLDQGGAITKGARGTLTLKDEVVSIVLSSVSNKNATAVVRLPPHKFTGNLVVKINAN